MLSSSARSGRASEDQLDLVFRALGDRTRRHILSQLTNGPAMVTELAQPFDMSLPAVGKHLRVLEKAGLVSRRIDGRIHRCSLNALPLKGAEDWLQLYQRFWDESLDSLAHFVEGTPRKNHRQANS